jgi:uncharacterized protein with PIN domain
MTTTSGQARRCPICGSRLVRIVYNPNAETRVDEAVQPAVDSPRSRLRCRLCRRTFAAADVLEPREPMEGDAE